MPIASFALIGLLTTCAIESGKPLTVPPLSMLGTASMAEVLLDGLFTPERPVAALPTGLAKRGARMVRRMVPILVLTLAVVGCGAISNVRSEAPPGRLCLQVADAETMIQLEGVSISAITRDGEVPLGTTDEHGAVCVRKRTLASYDPSLILFCRQGFFCGALKTREDMSGHDFLDFDEHFITLARFKIG